MPQVLRRLGWASLDQGLSSVSNLLLAIAVARNASTSEFGLFGLLFTMYLLALGVQRALVGEPSLVRGADWNRAARTDGTAGALAVSALLGLVLFLVSLLALVVSPDEASAALLAFGVAAPGLMLLDVQRYLTFARGQPGVAAGLDAAWLVLQVVAFVLLATTVASPGPWSYLLAWGLAGEVVGLVAFVAGRRVPAIRHVVGWSRMHGRLGRTFLAEFALASGLQHGLIYIVAGFAGVPAAGAVRGAQTVLGPATVITGSANLVLLPHARSLGHRPRELVRFLGTAASGLAAVIVLTCLAVVAVPPGVGESLLGDSWAEAQRTAPALAVVLVVNCLGYGAVDGLRALDQSRSSLRVRARVFPLTLTLVCFGAWWGGAIGALAGLAFGNAVQCVSWWRLLVRNS